MTHYRAVTPNEISSAAQSHIEYTAWQTVAQLIRVTSPQAAYTEIATTSLRCSRPAPLAQTA